MLGRKDFRFPGDPSFHGKEMHHVSGQHWMLILGVLCGFYTCPGCEMSYEWPVQPQRLGTVLPGMAAVPWLPWAGRRWPPSRCGQAWLCARGNFSPVADGSKVSKTQAVKVISEVFGQEITRDLCSLSGPTEAVIKRNMKLRKM